MKMSVPKLVLALVCFSAAIVLGPGRAAAPDGCTNHTLHLDIAGQNLVLIDPLPPGATTKFIDSPALSRSGSNPYVEIGEWETYFGGGVCRVESVSPLHAWLGLRNSDDQGANFDLKVEVRVGNVLVAVAEQTCIKGLTRNPALAREIVKAFPPALQAREGEVTLTLYARIGTPQNTC